MTTIAWDGHSLAADQGVWCNGRLSQGSKIVVVELRRDSVWGEEGDKLIVANMGSVYCNERVRHHLECREGCEDLNVLDTGHESGDVIAVVIDKNRHVWDLSPLGHRYRSGCTRLDKGYGVPKSFLEDLPVTHSAYYPDYFSAWGAGGTFALGALATGAEAFTAIELAMKCTEFAAVGVDVVKWADVFNRTTEYSPQSPDLDIPF